MVRSSGVPLFVAAVRRIHSVRFWAAFTLTIHINALYIESIPGREEHAT